MCNKRRHSPRIKIGISSCLLGQKVRYDGAHKHHSFLVHKLGRDFELVPVCPEVGIGMPVPRPPIHLVKSGEEIRVLDVSTHSRDYTDALYAYPEVISDKLDSLSGYILKKNSPSCGVEAVEIFPEENNQLPLGQTGSGMFVRSVRDHYPLLPMEDEDRLCDPELRQDFIRQVLVYRRWRYMSENNMKQKDLFMFHTEHQPLIMSYDRKIARELQQMIIRAGGLSLESVKLEYITTLMCLLGSRVKVRNTANGLPD